jgi:cation transport ATPase
MVAAASALLGVLPGVWPSVVAALSLAGLSGIFLARFDERNEVGPIAWAAGPLGGALLAASALFNDAPAWTLFAAALGVAVLWLRSFLARQSALPIEALLQDLKAHVPPRSRVSLNGSEGDGPTSRDGPTASIRAGEEVIVDAGEVVPVDGVVSAGEAQVVPFPSAQQPVWRGPNAAVLAGAQVVEGSIRVMASRVGAARALFRPGNFGLEGGAQSATITRFATRARKPLVGVLIVGLALVLAVSFGDDLATTLAGFGAALLALPALSLTVGVRAPFVSASALAVCRGIVFRDASVLERAGRVTAAALCTDGTVTSGTANLVEVSPLTRGSDTDELTALAMGAEQVAEPHPLAQAVRRYGEARSIVPTLLRRAAYARGMGVTALVDGGGALVLGNRQSLLTAGVSVAVADREAQRAESEGRTVVFLAVGGRARALFVFEDPVRPEARAAVQQLIDLDVEVVLLSGDHRATVEALARPLDITHVKAELCADERAAEVGRLRDAGGDVAVIGRDPSDETSLTAADIAITLDAVGSALEGDVTVASEDLRDAAYALAIARRARRTAQAAAGACIVGGLGLATLAAIGILHPAAVLLMAAGIDAWILPSATRLLPKPQLLTSPQG